jgi:hypothetical protein
MEYYENSGPTTDEIIESENMIREDRKNELRKLAYNQGLQQKTYYLINKQFERELILHPPKDIEERVYDNKPKNYPKVLMINEPVIWEESMNNLISRPYKQPLYHGNAVEDDFGIRYHFNQIESLDNSIPVVEDVNAEEKIYVPTYVYGAFRYVINKEKNISSTHAVKIQAGLTIQIEKHSKTAKKGFVQNKNTPTYEIRHDYQDQSKMLPYLYVFPTKGTETQKYLYYLNGYISQILEHIYGDFSTKFICISGISFYIYRLSKIGSKIIGVEKYIKNQNIYNYLSGEHICVLEYIHISVYLEQYKN